MTVRQLIERLTTFPQDALVYVPSSDNGKNGTVQFVVTTPHTRIPFEGIRIDADVSLLPGDMERFVLEPDASDEDRQGES